MDPVVSNTMNKSCSLKPKRKQYFITDSMKECSNCHQMLDFSHYYIRTSTGTPGCSTCKKCTLEKNREKKKNDPNSIAWHKHREEVKKDGRSHYQRNGDIIRKRAMEKYNAITEYGIPYGRVKKLQKVYKTTPEHYIQLLSEQENKCAICEMNLPVDDYIGKARVITVDHCHITGKVRGVLCDLCNRGIGYFKENIDSLANAIKYLNHYNGTSNK